MALINQKQKEKYNKDVKKYFTTKRVLIAVITLFVFIMYSAQLKGVILLALFFPLAKYSVKITAFVPHVTLEQYTSATLLMAYLYGPVVGAISGFMLGFYGYFSNGISKFLALVNVFIAGFIGFMLGHLVKNGFLKSWSFYSAFVLGILVFNAIAFVI
ncbi:MAG: hypothetical protein NDI94_06570, partial [Candidatus Woesearchaeota archaeon]|nr:hypothetical protein [Candidatus Woesearchaeota archaeon]